MELFHKKHEYHDGKNIVNSITWLIIYYFLLHFASAFQALCAGIWIADCNIPYWLPLKAGLPVVASNSILLYIDTEVFIVHCSIRISYFELKLSANDRLIVCL